MVDRIGRGAVRPPKPQPARTKQKRRRASTPPPRPREVPSSFTAAVQRPEVTAKMNANIDDVLALNALGPGNVPEDRLPTTHPLAEGNKVALLVDGEVYASLLKDLLAAKDSIHISHFAVGDDKLGREVGKILMEKARAGVEVRVLVDPAGSGALIPYLGSTNRMLAEWAKAGVQVIVNRHIDPLRTAEPLNHIEHRKLWVLDGKTAYTGGMGIQEKYRSEWHDTMVRVEGEGARQMQVDYLKAWLHIGGRIDQRGAATLRERFFPEAGMPGATSLQGLSQIPGESPAIREAYLREIAAAKKSFYVENPYFTDARVITALKDAARRGVDVRVVVPGQTDLPLTLWAARGEYDGLLEAGVKVYEFPRMTHAKVAVRDGGEWSTNGSANLDSLSLNHNYEFNFQSRSKEFGERVEKMITTDIAAAKRITDADTRGITNLLYKVLDSAVLSYFM